jgi:hypothetical protein
LLATSLSGGDKSCEMRRDVASTSLGRGHA